MKGMVLMHYFLGLEVWKGYSEIFVGQGNYTTKMLQRFHMYDCRPMAMPLVTNWRMVDVSRVKRVYATVYRKLITSLMSLVNT